jgi:DHA1 family bicyclomycin/chloramphenicol resistance-like MFS transporter
MQSARTQKLVYLAAVAALTSLGVDMSLPAVPSIEASLAAHTGIGVMASSLFMAGFALTPLFGGPLSDSLGRIRVLFLSLAAFALAALGCALAPSLTIFLGFRLLQGCAAGIATTLPLAIVSDRLSGSPARQMMSEINTLSSFMPLLAPALGSAALLRSGWRMLFAVEALYGCLLAALACALPESLAPAARQPLHPRRILQNCATLLTQPVLRNLALVYGMAFAATFCFTAVSPLVLIQRMGMSRSAYALIFALNSAGSILGAATSAWLNRRGLPAQHIVRAGLSLAASATTVGLLFQLHQPALPVALLPAAFLSLFGFNLAGPSLLVEALHAAPHLHGSSAGMMRSIFTALNFASSTLLGVFCAQHLNLTERAAASGMALPAGLALALYLATAHHSGTFWAVAPTASCRPVAQPKSLSISGQQHTQEAVNRMDPQ